VILGEVKQEMLEGVHVVRDLVEESVERVEVDWCLYFISLLESIDNSEKGRVRASVSKVGILRIIKGRVFGPDFDNFPNYE
jgi:hypothetical protein